MAQYYRVSPNFWKGRRSWSDREKLLAQYLLSCPHRNLEGLYWLPLAYIEADLGWNAKVVRGCLATLQGERFAAYDEDAQVMFVCKALAYQAPSTPKQVIGAVNSLERVPKTQLWTEFVEACERWAPKLAEAIRSLSHTDQPQIASVSHSNEIPNEPGSQPDIARTRSSNSNSNSSSIPPQPPKGGRKRDQEIFEEQLANWRDANPPITSDEWDAFQRELAERVDATARSSLGNLHLHANGDSLLIGCLSNADGFLAERFGAIFEDIAGKPVQLVGCGCT